MTTRRKFAAGVLATGALANFTLLAASGGNNGNGNGKDKCRNKNGDDGWHDNRDCKPAPRTNRDNTQPTCSSNARMSQDNTPPPENTCHNIKKDNPAPPHAE